MLTPLRMEMCNYYILTCSDTEDIEGKRVPALKVAKARLKIHAWPLYKNTRNRRAICPGDICLIYLAGTSDYAQHLIAMADVGAVSDYSRMDDPGDDSILSMGVPTSILQFKKITLFDTPSPIRPLLEVLSFTNTDGRSWGGSLQGGCRHISYDDFRLIAGV